MIGDGVAGPHQAFSTVVLGPYRELFGENEARRLVLASLSARVAIGAFTLPMLLAVQQATRSFATAGVAAGAFSLAVAAVAPVRGRLVDARGPRRALPPMVIVSAGALVLLAALSGRAPSWTLVLGPMLAGLGIATIGARATLGACGVALALGTLAFAAVARTAPLDGDVRVQSPIRLPGVMTLVLMTALADVALGAVDVLVPAFAVERGSPAAAGVLLAVFSTSSVVGALVFGARSWRPSAGTQLLVLLMAGAVTVGLLAAASSLLALGALLALAGAPAAPQWAASSLALDAASGGRGRAEAFTWLSAANGVGIAAGSVLGGAAVERWGLATAFVLAAAGPASAALVIYMRRATLVR